MVRTNVTSFYERNIDLTVDSIEIRPYGILFKEHILKKCYEEDALSDTILFIVREIKLKLINIKILLNITNADIPIK